MALEETKRREGEREKHTKITKYDPIYLTEVEQSSKGAAYMSLSETSRGMRPAGLVFV
jgi:hypothetical protein